MFTEQSTKSILILIISLVIFGFFSSSFVLAYGPTVNLKADNSDGPITVPFNSSVVLSWTTSDAVSCLASGGWSGAKLAFGSEITGKLKAPKIYTLTCTGVGGAVSSDNVRVNVSAAPASATSSEPALLVKKLVRNLSKGTAFKDSISASPGDVVSFLIEVTNNSTATLKNIIIKDTLPEKIIYRRHSLKIDNASSTADIIGGFNLGSLPPERVKKITFETDLALPGKFSSGQTQLVNNVFVSDINVFGSASAEIIVRKGNPFSQSPTSISTAFTNNIFFDSFLLPLIIAVVVVLIFKRYIIEIQYWLKMKQRKLLEQRTEKLLQLKIARIKARELLQKAFFNRDS